MPCAGEGLRMSTNLRYFSGKLDHEGGYEQHRQIKKITKRVKLSAHQRCAAVLEQHKPDTERHSQHERAG